jgi:hypothetical protein
VPRLKKADSTVIPLTKAEMLESSLATLLTQSVQRGHGKVALQRMLMLDAQHHAIPDSEREYCERVAKSASPWELKRMRRVAEAWAQVWRLRRQLIHP